MSELPDPTRFSAEKNAEATPLLRTQAGETNTLLQWLPHVPPGLEAVTSGGGENDDTPIARMINTLLIASIAKGASEVQLGTGMNHGAVLVRVAGMVTEMARVPATVQARLINRLKLMADIPYWRPAPQTGLIRLQYNSENYNVQVRTTTARRNDFLTLHIVEAKRQFGPGELNVPEPVQTALNDAIYDKGLILLIGPSGSGKTTLAFSWLCHLQRSGCIAGTVEDLPAYLPDDLIQTFRTRASSRVSVRERASSVIKQNVDVLFCGDLTDENTCNAAIESAEAGVLTIACVSATSTVGALTQLVRLGERRSCLGSVLSGMVMQTLAGAICEHCRHVVPWNEQRKERLARLHVGDWNPTETLPTTAFDGAGCDKCQDTGVSGRTSLLAFTEIDDDIRPLLQPDQIQSLMGSAWAQKQANLLLSSTYDAIRSGLISISEAERAVRPIAAAVRRLI